MLKCHVLHHHRMYVENELVEIETTDVCRFEEIVEEYEEEILVQEEISEPPLTDSANTAPAQGKPRCITSIFHIHRICICVLCIYIAGKFCGNHMHIYIYPMSSTSAGLSRCYA